MRGAARRALVALVLLRPAGKARVGGPGGPGWLVWRCARGHGCGGLRGLYRAAGRRGAGPVLVLWALRDELEELYGDVLGVWRPWAADLRGRGLDCGHHMSEEAPDELAAELLAFLATA